MTQLRETMYHYELADEGSSCKTLDTLTSAVEKLLDRKLRDQNRRAQEKVGAVPGMAAEVRPKRKSRGERSRTTAQTRAPTQVLKGARHRLPPKALHGLRLHVRLCTTSAKKRAYAIAFSVAFAPRVTIALTSTLSARRRYPTAFARRAKTRARARAKASPALDHPRLTDGLQNKRPRCLADTTSRVLAGRGTSAPISIDKLAPPSPSPLP